MFPHSDKFKAAGVSIHVICTGAGAGLQKTLWEVPGSSAYLSGASFPYRQEETVKTLGFTPDSYCSREASIDLACVAYMRAYSFGGKRPIGLGLTASVASEKEHRGDHRVHACVISDERVIAFSTTIGKAVGEGARISDGRFADSVGLSMLMQAVDPSWHDPSTADDCMDVSTSALERFFERPFFGKNGDRLAVLPEKVVLYPGSYNPVHPGHLGLAKAVGDKALRSVVFHVTTDGPHKSPLGLQDLLKRVRMLRGHDRFFTRGDALFVDKARRFRGVPIAIGADSLLRMLDPKWGPSVMPMLYEMAQLGSRFYVAARTVDGELLTLKRVIELSGVEDYDLLHQLFESVDGVWDFSSTQERAKLQT